MSYFRKAGSWLARSPMVCLVLCLSDGAWAEEGSGAPIPLLTEEQLTNYPFSIPLDETPPKVEELSVGEQFVLDSQRGDIEDLVARKLGVLYLKGSREDLSVLQRLVDGGYISSSRTNDWQSLGVVFGDILAEELDLRWVMYEDDLGESRALQFRKTQSFVFPVTMFSKRVQFGQTIDIPAIFAKIQKDVEGFVAFEAEKVRYDANERRLNLDSDQEFLPPDR